MTKPHLTIYIRVKITLILIIAVVFASFSQNSIGIGTVTPHQSAILDVYSTHKGFLPPRMSATEMDVINSPSEGLIVYCLDCNPKGIYVRSGNEFKMTQFFAKPVEYLNIDDVSITRGTTSFNIFPTLIPNEATVDYELIRNPIEGIMEGTRINISPDLAIGEYNITVKAIGKDNYNGKTGATFKLNITPIPLTGLRIADVSIPIGTTFFNISPTLTPSEATVDYELINHRGGVMEGTRINISPNLDIGEYNIIVKATGNGNYTGETETAFRLRIIPNDDFVIVFNDANFETAVKRNLGIVFYENVKYRDVKDVIELDVSSQGITNIEKITNMEEIRYFTVLESLECYNNQLRSLDLSQNTVLKELYCYNNQLPSLDLSQNTVLEKLGCHNNQLTSLDLSQNTVLKELYCSNNQLTSLDLSQNTVLNVLYCQNNQLTSLDIRGMRRVDEGLTFNNTTLQTLKVHQSIKDHQSIITLKRARGNNVTISTYSASPGSTTYNPICNNYNPRGGGGTCND